MSGGTLARGSDIQPTEEHEAYEAKAAFEAAFELGQKEAYETKVAFEDELQIGQKISA